jgi:hypothetical protein
VYNKRIDWRVKAREELNSLKSPHFGRDEEENIPIRDKPPSILFRNKPHNKSIMLKSRNKEVKFED